MQGNADGVVHGSSHRADGQQDGRASQRQAQQRAEAGDARDAVRKGMHSPVPVREGRARILLLDEQNDAQTYDC
jgi:hypothetical protein